MSERRAIVVGGSLAGLLAARVLADHFPRVLLLERDELARSAEPRTAVPQGRHVHVLLQRGQQIVAGLFPDLLPALREEGVVDADMGAEFKWHHFGVWKRRFESGIRILFLHRPLFEWHVARRVAALPNVEIREGVAVQGLAVRDGRVAGVETAGGRLDADLVVEAGGRGSTAPRWLEAAGFPRPDEELVEVKVGYASRIYRRPPVLPDWKGLFVIPRPPAKRAAAIFPLDGERWLVTLAGWLADYPPVEEEGFREFARSLPVPDVHLALQGAEPLTPIVPHRFPSNLRRHYEKLGRRPEGFVVLGDALCSFNPVYGQGMTVAAMTVAALESCLRTGGPNLAGLARRFQRAAARVVDVPWQLAVGEDLRYPEVTGRKPFGTAVLHRYVGRVHEKAGEDTVVAQTFYRVLHLLSAPPVLFKPSVLLRLRRS